MYLLPKIHKPVDKWSISNKMPPGRPIVSDCGSESYHVSEYIDHFLQAISCKHDSYVKDTNDFLAKLREVKVKPETLLVTMDVESMYTNIDNEAGLKAVKNAFSNNPNPRRSDEHVLELLEICLKTMISNLTMKLTYKCLEQPWARNLRLHMPTYSWQHGKLKPCKRAP